MALKPAVATADGGSAAVAPDWLGRRALAVRGALALFRRRVFPILFFGLFPALVMVHVLWLSVAWHSVAFDFQHAYWPAGRDVLHGRTPFPPPTHAALAGRTAYVYPPPAAFLVAPLSLLPVGIAEVVFTAILAAAAVATLRLAGVRDWRVYGAAFLWPPVFSAVQAGTLTLLLSLALAVFWRVRDRPVAAGLAAAFVVSLKLFLWPVALWLVATRRYRAAAWTAVLTAALVFGSWAVLGFDGLATYPRLLHVLTQIEQDGAYTAVGFGLRLGVPLAVGHAVGVVLGSAVLAASIWAAWTRRGDTRSLGLAVFAALLLSPIVWLHYWAVLLVPFALLRPRFTPLWLLPLALSMAAAGPEEPTLYAGVAIAVFGAMVAVGCRQMPATLSRGTGRIRLVA